MNFRIGLNDGPQILFKTDFKDVYTLNFRDEKGEVYIHPIDIGSDQFVKCQKIRKHIHQLNNDKDYIKKVDEQIEFLLTNVVNFVKPIIAKLPKQN